MNGEKKCFVFISTLEHIPWGGCEDLWVKTALKALDENQEVFVIVFKHTELPRHIAALEQAGAQLLFLERKHVDLNLKKRITNKLWPDAKNKNILIRLSQKLKHKSNVRILISQAGGFDFSYNYLDPVYDWLLHSGISYWVVVQNVPDLGFTVSESAAEKQKTIYQKAEGVGFVSDRNRICAERILVQKIVNAFRIDNPLNFRKVPELLDFPSVEKKISMATVAALRCSHKGQDILLQVLAGEKWKIRSWELNFYGTGPDESYLRKLAAFYGLVDRVFFHGHQQDIGGIWKANHIHILPSLGEGTPLALIESMLCGRLAITTDVGGNAEYCTHLQSGFITAYPTLPAMDEIMEIAWAQRAKWKEMGEVARKDVLEKYDLQAEATLYNMLHQ